MSNPLDQLRDNHTDFNKNQDSFDFHDPFLAFQAWFDLAVSAGEKEANAMEIKWILIFIKICVIIAQVI